MQVVSEYFQALVEVEVVIDDDVCFIYIRLNVFFKGWQYVVFVMVQYVFQWVVVFELILFDVVDYFEVFFGMQEDLDVKQVVDFMKMIDEDVFYQEDRGWVEGQYFGICEFVIESVFLFFYWLFINQMFNIMGKSCCINGFWEVEVVYVFEVLLLFFLWVVIVILRDYINLVVGELFFELVDEGCFVGFVVVCNVNDQRFCYDSIVVWVKV